MVGSSPARGSNDVVAEYVDAHKLVAKNGHERRREYFVCRVKIPAHIIKHREVG